MAGTGFYCVKKAPAHNDDAQSGAPAGQVVSLVTGGLGTASAWAGGYVVNQDANGVETRAIVLHVDDAVTLEGDLSNWDDGDDLDVYDAWGTIADALGQLWTDQAAVAFTASQYVRIFAGTWAENVSPNAGLNPDENAGYLFILEGDPADGRDNIIIAPAAGVESVKIDFDYAVIRHLKIAGTPGSSMIYATSSCVGVRVFDCVIHGAKRTLVLHDSVFMDCQITITADAEALRLSGTAGDTNEAVVHRCVIVGPGSGSSNQLAVICTYGILDMESTVVSGFYTAVGHNSLSVLLLRNCVFYDCVETVFVNRCISLVQMTNCIISGSTKAFFVAAWPEESATRFGPKFLLRNNYYHNYTDFGYDGASTRTRSQWVAFNLVDASGEVDEVDPEFTDAASGDFSLKAASPCRHAGHGSGVAYDYLGNEFHPNTPDVGAWSSEDSVSSVVWPASLPQTVDQPTFAEGFAPTVERSEMDSGPAKVRRRFTSGVQTFEATVTLTVAQAATLQAFFDTTTMGGSLSFYWTHPRTGATATMRFLEPPSLTQPGPQHFVASLALEILP